jgi:hypothetical protein
MTIWRLSLQHPTSISKENTLMMNLKGVMEMEEVCEGKGAGNIGQSQTTN